MHTAHVGGSHQPGECIGNIKRHVGRIVQDYHWSLGLTYKAGIQIQENLGRKGISGIIHSC